MFRFIFLTFTFTFISFVSSTQGQSTSSDWRLGCYEVEPSIAPDNIPGFDNKEDFFCKHRINNRPNFKVVTNRYFADNNHKEIFLTVNIGFPDFILRSGFVLTARKKDNKCWINDTALYLGRNPRMSEVLYALTFKFEDTYSYFEGKQACDDAFGRIPDP